MADFEVKVPDIGDFDDVPIVEVLVSEGDEVSADDPLITLESDKSSMDVPSPESGTVESIAVEVGDKLNEGDLILKLSGVEDDGDEDGEGEDQEESGGGAEEGDDADGGSEGDSADDQEAAAEDSESDEDEEGSDGEGSDQEDEGPAGEAGRDRESSGSDATPTQTVPSGDPIYASPAVRRTARKHDVDLTKVEGSGRKGRITKEDVEGFEGGATEGADGGAGDALGGLDLAPWPDVDHSEHGEVERVEQSRIKQISAPNLHRNWIHIPHVTHHDDADITELEAFRKQINSEQDEVKVTMVALLAKALIPVLRKFPTFNSSLEPDGHLTLKHHFHIGFAADTPQGLLVPVIRDADQKGLLEIAADLIELSEKAREGKLGPKSMKGSTFTISSLGGIGGTGFTPIVNAPEVAILGVTRHAMKPVWNAEVEEFEPRLMVPLSLSYDHRVVDGAEAARFAVELTKVLSDFRRVIL